MAGFLAELGESEPPPLGLLGQNSAVRSPGLSVLELRVADLEGAARFYRDIVGVPLHLDDAGPDAPHYEGWWPPTSSTDHLYLALWEESDPQRVSRVALGFAVDDLEAVHERAEARGDVTVKSPPADFAYGRKAIYLDPDGNEVSVSQR
jgi:predicted enzyme related to lactoylglutathione lyase